MATNWLSTVDLSVSSINWSTVTVVFLVPEPGSDAEDQLQQDPRYWLQQIRRAQLQADDSQADDSVDRNPAAGAFTDNKKETQESQESPNQERLERIARRYRRKSRRRFLPR